jgi:hypothetical protein
VMYDGALIGSLAHTPMRGRFYHPDQLRFIDDSKVFEVTYPVLHKHFGSGASSSHSAAAAGGARPPPMLRVLGVYYGAQRDLFVHLLQRFKYSSWIPLCGRCGVWGVGLGNNGAPCCCSRPVQAYAHHVCAHAWVGYYNLRQL